MYGIIATWCMAQDGVKEASQLLANNQPAATAIVKAIMDVEDGEFYKSVGYGGLPNKNMEVELDAGYMDGTSFDIGMVGALQNVKNPILVAQSLSKLKANNFLVGSGAQMYAAQNGFAMQNMLTDRAKIHYYNRVFEDNQSQELGDLNPYNGHDTVGMVCLDNQNNIIAATSTSGLFMKHPGRLGDSPVIGSGFYADSNVGGASATGLGEDMMKTCVSFQIVNLMQKGYTAQDACQEVLVSTIKLLEQKGRSVGDISLIAMSKDGDWGCSTNIDNFSFVVATKTTNPTVYRVTIDAEYNPTFSPADEEWLKDYYQTRKKPLEKKYE